MPVGLRGRSVGPNVPRVAAAPSGTAAAPTCASRKVSQYDRAPSTGGQDTPEDAARIFSRTKADRRGQEQWRRIGVKNGETVVQGHGAQITTTQGPDGTWFVVSVSICQPAG